jgi:TetR/AcrR family tetracycline transcriptional repressor
MYTVQQPLRGRGVAHRSPIDRAVIGGAAARIVDREGPAAVSMRRVAAALGVTAMALYNHVTGKQDVLDAAAEQVLAEIDVPDPDLPWRDRVEVVFESLRQAYHRHPRAMPLVQTASSATPVMLRPMEAVLAALADGGLAEDAALELWSVLVGLTNGHVAYELAGHLRAGPEGVGAATIDPARFPHIAAALGTRIDWHRAFVAGLRGAMAAATAGARR